MLYIFKNEMPHLRGMISKSLFTCIRFKHKLTSCKESINWKRTNIHMYKMNSAFFAVPTTLEIFTLELNPRRFIKGPRD